MKKFFESHIITTGLAIFSMFFGAGNLLYPLAVGAAAGAYTPIAMIGFLLTSVCLPVAGLVAMLLFEGDYDAFFYRLGKPTGALLIFSCMLIIGPIIVIPRIVTLSHSMIAPFLPFAFLQSTLLFALIFLGVTFLLSYKEGKIVDVLGNVISPVLLCSLTIIIIKGFFCAHQITEPTLSAPALFAKSFRVGYETLDLLAAIFFSSIILVILKKTMGPEFADKPQERAMHGLRAGILGIGLLGIVYAGMSYLGAYFGHGLAQADLFREVSLRVLGSYGAIIVSTAVLGACLSTSVALSAVLAEYIQHDLLKEKLGYVQCLALVLLASIPLSIFGLGYVLQLTGGIITYVGYPVLIALTICNILYKTINFKYVKVPVGLTFVVSLISYYWF